MVPLFLLVACWFCRFLGGFWWSWFWVIFGDCLVVFLVACLVSVVRWRFGCGPGDPLVVLLVVWWVSVRFLLLAL